MSGVSCIPLREGQQSSHKFVKKAEGEVWSWRKIWAVVGLAGGMVSVLLGSIFTAITWLTGANEGSGLWLHRIGEVFLLMTIPLLLIGAHCLDLEDAESKRDLKTKRRDERDKIK